LRANKLVHAAISVMSLTTLPMRLAASDSSKTCVLVFSAYLTASPAILLDS
jgi:hypothetical protein